MYEIGKVYIWQNMAGELACLNGQETTVTGPLMPFRGVGGNTAVQAQATDTRSPRYPGIYMVACLGDLRPKNPPSGEQRVRDMFDQLPTEAQLQAHAVDEALENGTPFPTFNCRCVPLPITKKEK